MKIFYGPPGTGKTYTAAREAVRIVDGDAYHPATVSERHRQLVAEGRIRWVTFHPSYAYEDFVEGYRPRLDEDGNVIYVPVDGPFKQACDACRRRVRERFRVGQEIGRYQIVHVDPGGLVLRSEVVREDRVSAFQHTYVDLWTIQRFQAHGVPPEMMSLAGPRVEEKQELARMLQLPAAFWTASSPYRAVYEALVEEQDGRLESAPVVLVIDEINRADLSRVFGELFTLLEIDKREGAPEEARVTLPYSGDQFTVPMCLSVIGTMNTADRSLAVVDVALRRRFEFEEINPEPSLCPMYGGVDIGAVLGEWNRRISLLRSRDYRIGHAELMRGRLEVVRRRAGWGDDEDGQLRALAETVRQKILPLLLEYFPADWRKADIVVGRGRLLEPEDLGEIAEDLREVLDIEVADDVSFTIPDWWDPADAQWNATRFRTALLDGVGQNPAVAPTAALGQEHGPASHVEVPAEGG